MELIAADNRQIIVGLGATGLSCARYFARKNIPFTVVDSRQQPPGLQQLKEDCPDVDVVLGEFSADRLVRANRLVVSPGVSLDEPAIVQAQSQGVEVCGDIDLFREEVSHPVVAITGSNGKSTVTALVGEMAKCAGWKVAVGGNFGTPALDLLAEPEPDLYVLELSSFQLERTEHLAADVATVLNISADHMDRYDNLLSYHQAKHRIFRGCKKMVVNRGDNLSRPLLSESVDAISFGLDNADFNGFGLQEHDGDNYLCYHFKPLFAVKRLKIAGRHNIENALAALAIGQLAGLPMDAMLSALDNFAGLPHRCQWVAEASEVAYFNDSKGTNVGAAIAAITGLLDRAEKIVLLAGGVAKGADFQPLLPILEQHVRALVVFGEAAESLAKLCVGTVPVIPVADMAEAVKAARAYALSGDAVLLSPACASFDMFDNYQHRGDVFTAEVLSVLAKGDG